MNAIRNQWNVSVSLEWKRRFREQTKLMNRYKYQTPETLIFAAIAYHIVTGESLGITFFLRHGPSSWVVILLFKTTPSPVSLVVESFQKNVILLTFPYNQQMLCSKAIEQRAINQAEWKWRYNFKEKMKTNVLCWEKRSSFKTSLETCLQGIKCRG